jgi:two-component system NarL family response regulator
VDHKRRPIRVLVADDHPVVLQGLVRLLSTREIEIVAAAATGVEAVAKFREVHPDVAILDLRMPGMSGMEALREIRASHPDAKVLIWTAFYAEEDVYLAIHAGARGYILKEASGREIIEAVVTIHDGQRYIPESISTRLGGRIGQTALTPRELEVLTLASRGDKNKEIGAHFGITEGTVKGYIHNIRLKLQARNRTAAVAIAIKRGIISIDGA